MPVSETKWAFFSSSGEFRREATQSEMNHFEDNDVLLPIQVDDRGIFEVSHLPMWHELWRVTHSDDSRMIPSLSSNGGAYGERTVQTFYGAKMPKGKWAFRVNTRQYNTSEFFQDDAGLYCQSEDCTDFHMTNTAQRRVYSFLGLHRSHHTENDVLERYTEETNLSTALAACDSGVTSPYTWDGKKEYDAEAYVTPLTFNDKKDRLSRLKELGIDRKQKTRAPKINRR